MRHAALTPLALVALLAAGPAIAGNILYATAATPGRVDGFCLLGDGSIASNPTVSVTTGDVPSESQPRKLLVGRAVDGKQVLYVAEFDRVEVFRIDPHGGLRRIGATPSISGMRPLNMALSADSRILYVPQTGRARVAAYPLEDDGSPKGDFTSCIQGPDAAVYQHILINDSLLYVTNSGLPDGVQVFPINADGSLPAAPDQCRNRQDEKRPPKTAPSSVRNKLSGVKALALKDGVLYVVQRGVSKIDAFRLMDDGNFQAERTKGKNGKKKVYQKPLNTTDKIVIYEGMILYKNTLLVSNFGRGRIDAYAIRKGRRQGKLPKQPTVESQEDVRMSPVGIYAFGDVVYVGGGALDQVIAYRLRKNGSLRQRNPFSETARLNGSFPNDVTVAVLDDTCL
jgi:6-phosphogluconolactonase (cycloisomerase 2 family)